MADYCVVVGGVNVDIGGKPDSTLVARDSNPGRINTSLGGVGRNIAHNLSLLGKKVVLVTALGRDANADRIIKSCKDLNIDIEGYLESLEDNTSSYLFITDETGDMSVAINDMNIYQKVTPEYIAGRMDSINKAGLVIVDTNIPAETIDYLTAHCRVPVFADPVSCAKATRLQSSLGRIHTITPNIYEAEILADMPIRNDEDLKAAADKLLKMGIKRVFITLGPDGLFAADERENFKLDILPCKLVNATGAGDAMMAGFAYAFMEGKDLRETAEYGLAAAAIAVEGSHTINESMSIDLIKNKLNPEEL